MTAERTPDARVEAAVERMARVMGWQHLTRYAGMPPEWMVDVLGALASNALAAADAVQREGLTERVAEALGAHTFLTRSPSAHFWLPTCSCGWSASTRLVFDQRTHQSAAVVAAIYGERP